MFISVTGQTQIHTCYSDSKQSMVVSSLRKQVSKECLKDEIVAW